ncbi:hypothetical protein B0H17DRAFT_1085784, partial [Mycena rosella]
ASCILHPKSTTSTSILSDSDGVDSPTYDIELSATAGSEPTPVARLTHHHHASSTSTFDAQILSSTPGSTPGTTTEPRTVKKDAAGYLVFLSAPLQTTQESAVAVISKAMFNPAALTPEDIQAFVQKAIDGETWRTYKINPPPVDRPVRVYADGRDPYSFLRTTDVIRRCIRSLPFRVPSGAHMRLLNYNARHPGTRCSCARLEAARHCGWVDEIVFIDKYQIDYVAHDEEPYAASGHEHMYAFCKNQGKFIPIRRTPGVSTSELLERIASGYRHREFDEKLVKIGTRSSRPRGATTTRAASPAGW